MQGVRYRLPARRRATSASSCFGPLEVAYDFSALDPASAKRKIQAGSAGIWRYADFLPFEAGPPAERGALEPGLTPLVARRQARRPARARRGVDQERRREPDALVQGPRRRGRAGQGARARLRDGRLRLDRQPRERRRRACRRRPGFAPTSSSPPTSRSRSCSPPASTARRWSASRAPTTTSTGSAPSSREARGWAFVNVNLRPYYAEGSKTLAYETVEQLGWKIPDRVVCPIASGSLFSKLGRGLSEWLDLGLVEGELPTFNGAQAEGCSPVASAYAEGRDVCTPVKPDTIAKSLAIGDPADGPYALDLARRTGGSIDAVTRRRDPRRHPAAGRDDRHLHRDRRRRHDRGAGEARRARRDRRRRAGRRLHHRRGPEDPRRDPRGLRDARDRADPRARSRPKSSEAAGCR